MWKFSLHVNGNFVKETTFTDGNEPFIIGREADSVAGFRLEESSKASRIHCKIFSENNRLYLVDLNSTNGTYINGRRLSPQLPEIVDGGCTIDIGGKNITVKISTITKQPKSSVKNNNPGSLDYALQTLQTEKRIVIGRGSECDFVINQPNVSRKHAYLHLEGNSYFIEDLNSTNGVYVNQQKISGREQINASDAITIGGFTFGISAGVQDETGVLAIQAIGIEKRFGKTKIGLHELTLNVEQGKLLGIMGPSGCGKSTLLKALNGEAPITKGKVLIKGWDLIKNYNLVKTYIGYVPQDDILHKDLTVEESLYYTAKLRLADPTEEYIDERINSVLQRLMIDKVRKSKISDLSGGQRKRVCIASELLTSPAILFLDEPTSPLDPQTIEEFLKILKDLSNDGTTVLMVTHKPEDLEYLDKVVFLTTGGHMVYYDKVKEINNYFNVKKITNIYSKIDNPASEETKSWIQKYKKISNATPSDAKEYKADLEQGNYPFLLQIYWLVKRNINIKWNDKVQLGVPILGPPLITFVFCLLFNHITLQVLFLVAVTSIFFGIFSSCGEIVKEQQIYLRERMFNLRILPYLLSKVIFSALLSSVQAGLMTLVIFLKYKNSDIELHLNNPMLIFGWLFATYMCASMIGLLISAVCKKMEQVNMWVPYVVLLQIIFSGVMTKLKDKNNVGHTVSTLMISRWSTEGLCRIQDTISYDATPASFLKPTMPKVAMPANSKQQKPMADSGKLKPIATDTFATQVDSTAKKIKDTAASKKEAATSTKTEDSANANIKKISARDLFLENFPSNYKDKKITLLGSWANTAKLNMLFIGSLFAIFFGLTFYYLKKKDTL